MTQLEPSQSETGTNDHTMQQMANAVRALAMDAIQKANSGHPGMPMGMADAATVLFSQFMNFDPSWPDWPGRDRFVLSAGHGSMLLYAILHLTGYERPTMDDIKNFRQWESPTAGHPEFGECPGVEVTTGPLGQGLATAVGMALGERLAHAEFGAGIADHYTYVIAGDGCLMEGVSQEAISLAGHLNLNKMIVLWDDNKISIDGGVDLASSEDNRARFEAAGWHVQAVDGHDMEAVAAAIEEARLSTQPSMIACRTTIGYGAPTKQGTAATHGAPLGEEEIAGARKVLGWDHGPFVVPEDVRAAWAKCADRGRMASKKWREIKSKLSPEMQADMDRRLAGDLPPALKSAVEGYKAALIDEPVKVATRKASQMALGIINPVVTETVGGSADLTGSNLTLTAGMDIINADNFSGRFIHYGVREFGMAAVMNGLALYGLHIPYSGTFLVFTDYARPAMRLAALMGQRVIYVMTHDSIGLGEDGPTHQPIEHLASLRAMPNMAIFRPADTVETAECWQLALERKTGPSVLSLSRQGVPQIRLEKTKDNLCERGGYILKEAGEGPLSAVLIATGTEVEIALAAAESLETGGLSVRVVSMPSTTLFDEQGEDYRKAVLPSDVLKVSIEAGTSYGWARYVGQDGIIIGIDRFGASAPAGVLYEKFGFTVDHVVTAVKERLQVN